MSNAIILHGMPPHEEYYDPKQPAQSNAHWLPWLQKQLQAHDIYCQTPEMPLSFKPDYALWKKEFERYDIGPETLLVGHSCGAGFIVRWLSENKDAKVGKVVLVAPWFNPDKTFDTGDFFNFDIDPKFSGRTKGVHIFDSDNDFEDVHTSVQMIADAVKGPTYREFHKYGHFCYEDMGTAEFPELLQTCLEDTNDG